MSMIERSWRLVIEQHEISEDTASDSELQNRPAVLQSLWLKGCDLKVIIHQLQQSKIQPLNRFRISHIATSKVHVKDLLSLAQLTTNRDIW